LLLLGMLALVFSLPATTVLGQLINLFPVFHLGAETVIVSALLTLVVAFCAAAIPVTTVLRLKVIDDLKRMQ
jgi:hypothetical protein